MSRGGIHIDVPEDRLHVLGREDRVDKNPRLRQGEEATRDIQAGTLLSCETS